MQELWDGKLKCISHYFTFLMFCYYRSGTEEEYSELQQLMGDISSYLRDLNAVKVAQAAQKEGQVKKAEEDKRKEEEMRRIAMEGSRSMFIANT